MMRPRNIYLSAIYIPGVLIQMLLSPRNTLKKPSGIMLYQMFGYLCSLTFHYYNKYLRQINLQGGKVCFGL
jgi:hypothetical protein